MNSEAELQEQADKLCEERGFSDALKEINPAESSEKYIEGYERGQRHMCFVRARRVKRIKGMHYRCGSCDGSGYDMYGHVCGFCGGVGFKREL